MPACRGACGSRSAIVRYYLHRWPSQRAMKRLREKVHARTGRNRAGADIREVIADINPLLRGWGNYFRTGNAAIKFRQIDDYVVWRLRSLMVKKRGRNLHAGQADAWTEDWFNGHGLYRLRGTVRYPRCPQVSGQGSDRILSGKERGQYGTAKRYAPEFKEQAAKKVVDNSLPIAQVARELGVNDTTLGLWVKAYRK